MRLLLSVFLCVAILPAIAQDEKVTAQLMADRTEIRQGEPFHLGVLLKMEDHWHTYFENPGFSGMPTSWSLKEVPGLTVEPLRFPWPKKFVDDAGFVTYGYDDEVLLLAQATYEGDASKLTIEGKINWLQCKELCIPGKANARLDLKVSAESKPVNEELFKRYLARLPQTKTPPYSYTSEFTFEEATWQARVQLTLDEGIKLVNNGVSLFPMKVMDDVASVTKTSLTVKGNTVDVVIDFEAYESAPENFTFEAITRVIGENGKHFNRIQLYPSKQQNQTAVSGKTATSNQPTKTETAASGSVDTSILLMLLGAFIGGMILNLMPCVLPVLSLKVFSLLKEAGESPMRRIKFGWVYTLGILSSFMVLSLFFVAAKGAGEQLGVGFQFQSPAFVIAISALIFIMGLSFLGVFHFGQPSSEKLHNLSLKGGYQGAFFQGALMTVLSTPCTAPFLGAAYGWALAQSAAIIMLTFSIVALGLAFPYLALCYLPGLLKFMPKPGPWMEQFKVTMGFLLMGTLVWLFSVLSDLTGTSGVVGTLALLVAIGAAAYIYGRAAYSDNPRRGYVTMVAVAALGIYLGMFQLFDIREPFKERETIERDMRLQILSTAGNSIDLADELEAYTTTEEEIAWVPYSEGNLDYFRKKNRLVFLDFTAAWCATCKVNERLVIDTAKIREAFAGMDVVTMKADYTDKDDELTLFIKSFERAGVPLYVVYPGSGEPILLPETITKTIVLDGLEKAQQQVNQRASL